MIRKKKYSQPQVYRVELNQDQAILSTCSLTATNPMAGGGDVLCRSGACKKAAGIGNSAMRPS